MYSKVYYRTSLVKAASLSQLLSLLPTSGLSAFLQGKKFRVLGAVSETPLYVGGMIVALHDSMLNFMILRMSVGQSNEGGEWPGLPARNT